MLIILLLAMDVSVFNLCVCCYEEFLNDMETMQYSRKLATSQMFHSVFLKGIIIMFSLEKSISGETSKKLTLKFYTYIHTCIYLSSYICVYIYKMRILQQNHHLQNHNSCGRWN